MTSLRQQTARQAAEKLRAARDQVAGLGVLVGLDGFVDEIIAVVDKRHDFDRFEPMRTIEHLGHRILGAAGNSSNLELVVKQVKLGGNGPIMAGALLAAGTRLTYVGSCGSPNIHPVFADLAAAAARMISIAEPGHTDAMEFDDGKIMLGKHASLKDVCWERLVEPRRPAGTGRADQWVGLGGDGQLDDAAAHERHLGASGRRDFSAHRRPAADVRRSGRSGKADRRGHCRGARTVAAFRRLGRRDAGPQSERSPRDRPRAGHRRTTPTRPRDWNVWPPRFARRSDLACVVIHPRGGASAATADGTASFAGPFVAHPKISTGAGDHFNAGFALGQLLSLSLAECLCAGVATSGYYVRTAHSPTLTELADFIAALPEREARGYRLEATGLRRQAKGQRLELEAVRVASQPVSCLRCPVFVAS